MGKFYFSNDIIEYLKTNKQKIPKRTYWRVYVLKLDSGKA